MPYKYTGKELDTTGLYYYEARYYDPQLGRFISADTLVPRPNDPQEFNRYAYAGNNPLKYTDPTGHFKIKFNKFFKRAFGDLGTTALGLGIQIFGGPIFGAANFVAGGAVLTQSKSGRYVAAGEIVAASAIASFMCGGCGTTLTMPLVGVQLGSIPAAATVGAVGVGTLGGISAANAGGDISSGVLVGTALGATAGALNGYLGGAVQLGDPSWSGAFVGKVALSGLSNMTGGAILNAASGASIGYAGGRGNWDTMLQAAGRSVVAGSKTDAATTVFGLAWDVSGPAQGLEVGWDVEPVGSMQTVQHVHLFNVSKSMATSIGDFFKLFGGNAPQWDELGNRRLRDQLRERNN